MNEQSEFNKLPAQALEQLDEVKKQVSSNTERWCSAANEYVHNNPWKAVGIAALSGALVTLLCRSRH
jgi:ElaB/YqjD/DUF883 family membrane-anchored ribosome-binding protein